MPVQVPSPAAPPAARRTVLSRVDALFDRLYGSPFNPLYQSGTIAALLLLVLLVTGLYLLLFYRIGTPYASVERIQGQVWTGRWVRALHRYASDAAVLAVAVHALRMFLRRRTWGPRALAWISGLSLAAAMAFIAVTGFVMVWDVQGRVLAVEGARILDVLPVFSEPVSRAFTGERPMPGAFFFLNYFLHIALPLGLALFFYLHVAHVARPVLLPARPLAWSIVGVLTGLSVVWPAPLAPQADASAVPHVVPVDWFFAFWLPVTVRLSPWMVWAAAATIGGVLLLVPVWTRPRRRAAPSLVDDRSCTGCQQCALDCPYDAIAMADRADGRPTLVAQVNPDRCVSCGICAGSCGPMSVGPPGRTGRDQLARVRGFLVREAPGPTDIVVVGCSRGAGAAGSMPPAPGTAVYMVDCAGSLHTSVVEFLVRSGVGGVLIVACPERDCWNREGTRWTRARLFFDREAELQARVDRARVRFLEAGLADRQPVLAALVDFRQAVREMRPARAESVVAIDALCDPPPESDTDGVRA